MSAATPVRIVIADDHFIFRRGFSRLLNTQLDLQLEFIGEACNGLELIEQVKKTMPDLVMTDIRMPLMSGMEACKTITGKFKVPVIALSAFDDEESIGGMLCSGACGLLSKNADLNEIREAIVTVLEGTPYYCSTVTKKIMGSARSFRQKLLSNPSFTTQEIKVMQLICQQLTTKEISSRMKLSLRTVEDYRHRLQEKTGSRNVAGVAIYAVVNGIVQLCDL